MYLLCPLFILLRPAGFPYLCIVMLPHSIFRRFVSLLLAALVLTASLGLTVQRLTCRMSGRSTVAVTVTGRTVLRGCMGETAPARPTAKDNCCTFSSHLHQLSTPAHELAAKILMPPAPLLATLASAQLWPVYVASEATKAQAPLWFAADTSPPLGGRGLLTFVCKLEV